jgi:hypothetical protein
MMHIMRAYNCKYYEKCLLLAQRENKFPFLCTTSCPQYQPHKLLPSKQTLIGCYRLCAVLFQKQRWEKFISYQGDTQMSDFIFETTEEYPENNVKWERLQG